MRIGFESGPVPAAAEAAAVLRIQLMEASPVFGDRISGVLGIGPGKDNKCPVALPDDGAPLLAVVLKTPR